MTNEEAIKYFKRHLDLYCVDGISREAEEMAIQALSQEPSREFEDYENEIEDLHNRLDIAEYDKERLREEVTNLEAKIQALEKEPCDDAISRKDIQDYIAKYLSQYLYEDVRQAVEAIDTYIGDMPSVTQKSDVLDKISKDIKKAIDDYDSVYYTSALHKALEIIDKYTK